MSPEPQKPIALTVDDAGRMCEAARRAGRTLFIGHVLRFLPAYHRIREFVLSAEYGRVLAAEFSRVTGLPGWGGKGWFTDLAKSGGMPIDLHIHDTDFILYAFGEPSAVQTSRAPDLETGFDVIRSTFRYGDAFVSSCGAWLQASVGFRAWASVTFERATVSWQTGADGDRLELYPADGRRQHVDLPTVNGYEAELCEFIRCAESGEPSEIAPPESALTSLAMVYREIAAADTPVSG